MWNTFHSILHIRSDEKKRGDFCLATAANPNARSLHCAEPSFGLFCSGREDTVVSDAQDAVIENGSGAEKYRRLKPLLVEGLIAALKRCATQKRDGNSFFSDL
jgi:hypothetical protein